LKVSGDLFGVHESTVSRIIKRVSIALASLYKQYVKFTSGNKVQEIQMQFMQQSRIAGIVGAIDCTYIPIQSPGGDTAESWFCLLSIIPFLLSTNSINTVFSNSVKFGDFWLAITDPIYHQNLNPGISCIHVRNC
jgi:hypothetical protein